MDTDHRYLDVITVRPSHGGSSQSASKNSHSSLLIEPILLPNLDHVEIENPKEVTGDNCLFYPNGHKSKNMNREIEQAVKSYTVHDELLDKPMKPIIKTIYNKTDRFANIDRPPLFHTRKEQKETKDLIKILRSNESKIGATVNIRL